MSANANQLVLKLDKKFKTAGEADEFLLKHVGTKKLDNLSDRDYKRLMGELHSMSDTKFHSNRNSRECTHCGVGFYRKYYDSEEAWAKRKYCSHNCAGSVKSRAESTKVCKVCEKTFERPSGMKHSSWKERRYCSRQCAGKGRSHKAKEKEDG